MVSLRRCLLMVPDVVPEDMDRVSVVQMTEISEYLSSTEEIIFEN